MSLDNPARNILFVSLNRVQGQICKDHVQSIVGIWHSIIQATTMSVDPEYDPLKWPPDLPLANLHYNCTKPGIDNTEGTRCTCCQRFEKLQNSKWPSRDIIKDFKNYGGGVPAYFYLLWYFMAFLVLLTLVKVIFHIMVIEEVCAYIKETYNPVDHPELICYSFFGIKFCDSSILYQQLAIMNKQKYADILQYLQLATYIILVFGTVGVKVFLQSINKDKISLQEKLFSRFSLIIKNVPLYYQIEDLKEQIKAIDPKAEFNEIFYLHKSSKFAISYRKLFDLYFQIHNLQQAFPQDDRTKQVQQLRKKYEEYLILYDDVEMLREGISRNTKKILIVFNTIQQKENVHKQLKMSEFFKFLHYMSKIFKFKSDPIGYYSERVGEPQELYWGNIGESSTHKQKVRMETTLIGVGFMFLSFAVFYFPMYKIDEEKYSRPGLGTGLGLVVSILIIILAIVYRQIILRLMPTRRPSSKLAQSYFIVMTTIVFHFFFYLVTPASFYLFAESVPKNMKLKQLFSAVLSFNIMCILVALIDLRYRLNKKKREKLLSTASEANNYCQQRLHQQITPPSFPIQFKIMVVFNIWSFNSYYIFQLPYLLLIFLFILFLLYWIDKYNLYKHYKMQQYLSIELEIKVQKTYIVLFLIFCSMGYYFTVTFLWEKLIIVGVAAAALILNFLLNLSYKKHKDEILKANTDLRGALQKCKTSMGQAFHLQITEMQLKSSFLIAPQDIDFSSVSLASEVATYGYQENYNLYLSQFKNKRMNDLLQNKYFNIKHSKTILDGRKRAQSELAKFPSEPLKETLLEDNKLEQAPISSNTLRQEKEEAYIPPKE